MTPGGRMVCLVVISANTMAIRFYILPSLSRHIYGTPLGSGRVTHKQFFVLESYIFFLQTYLGHQNLSCGVFISPQSLLL